MKLENETKVTVKSAEVARAILAAIMPNATPEKSSGYSISARAKKQNYFFEDVERELAYCEAYENDCETLKLFRICDFDKTFFVTIEIDSINGDDTEKAIEKICLAAGIEKVNIENSVEKKAEVKKFEVGKWYYDCCISANKSPAYKVTHRTKKMVTLTDDFGEIIKRKIDATSSVEKVSFNGDIMPIFLQADCFCTNAEEIQKAEDALAYSLAADNGNITVEETDPNAKLIACIDDYSVNVDAAAEVEEVNAENAKAAEKVAFFENLKETHDGKIFIDDVLEAWNLATCTLGKLKKNNTKTTNAGYTVLENSVGDWVSVLNDRFEVNLTTGQTFNVWTDSAAIENAKNYAWDEVEEGIFHAKNADEKTFWLNVCKAKFVNSLITLGVKDLIAAEIIREEEFIACIDEYRVDVDAAAEVEIENAKNAAFDKVEFEVGKIYSATDNFYDDCRARFQVVKRDHEKVVVQYFEVPPRHCVTGFDTHEYEVFTNKKNVECIAISERYSLYANDLHNGKYAGVSATDGKFEKMTIIDGVIHNDAVTEAEIENAKKTFEVKYLLGGYSEGTNHKATFTNFDIAKDFLKKLRNSDETFTVGKIVCDKATLWTLQATGDGFGFGNPISKTSAAEVEEVNAKPSEKEIFQDKIAEIKNRKHRIEEIFNLQRDFKKFLKLGEMKRAESVFENLKLCFKAA